MVKQHFHALWAIIECALVYECLTTLVNDQVHLQIWVTTQISKQIHILIILYQCRALKLRLSNTLIVLPGLHKLLNGLITTVVACFKSLLVNHDVYCRYRLSILAKLILTTRRARLLNGTIAMLEVLFLFLYAAARCHHIEGAIFGTDNSFVAITERRLTDIHWLMGALI